MCFSQEKNRLIIKHFEFTHTFFYFELCCTLVSNTVPLKLNQISAVLLPMTLTRFFFFLSTQMLEAMSCESLLNQAM